MTSFNSDDHWCVRGDPEPLPPQDLAEALAAAGGDRWQESAKDLVASDQVYYVGVGAARRDVGLWWRWAPIWFLPGSNYWCWAAWGRRRLAPRHWQCRLAVSELYAAYNPITGMLHCQDADEEAMPLIPMPDVTAYRLLATLPHTTVTA